MRGRAKERSTVGALGRGESVTLPDRCLGTCNIERSCPSTSEQQSNKRRQESTDHSSRMSTRAFDDTNITPHAQHAPDSYSRTCDLLGRILNSGKASTA